MRTAFSYSSLVGAPLSLALALFAVGGAGCASSSVLTGDGGADGGDAGTCDGFACTSGQLCCPGCAAGSRFCMPPDAPGGGCPLPGCTPPPICGVVACAIGDACCTDCDGAQYCSPGGACPGTPCPQRCGGLIGGACPAGMFCDFPTGPIGTACGGDDGTGQCVPRPAGCDGSGDSVCGCDGADYGSQCEAQVAGTDISSFGTCAAPTRDCRITGCATAESCIVCGPPGTGFSCVPDGIDCAL